MPKEIGLDAFARQIEKAAKQIPFATSLGLNRTANLIRSDIEGAGRRDLIFNTGSAKQKMGIRVVASTKTSLTAIVGTPREWLISQVESGTTRADQGINVDGVPHLLVPAPGRKKARGGLKKIPRGAAVFIKLSGGEKVLMARTGKRKIRLTPLGILTPASNHGNRLDWEGTARRSFQDHWPREFQAAMDFALKSAR